MLSNLSRHDDGAMAQLLANSASTENRTRIAKRIYYLFLLESNEKNK